MQKTIGILAHVDAGKTTLSEQLLFHMKSIRQRGRVDHQDTFLDHHAIERNRGITVFAEQGMFTYGDASYTLIDTPGHIDFSPEMERSIQVLDYAIILISAADGIEGHTETVWQLLRKHQVPTFFFINKTDRDGIDLDAVIENIKIDLTANVCSLADFHEGIMDNPFVEDIAELDETLFEHYLESGYDKELWLDSMKRLIQDSELFPIAHGSALKDIGVLEFFEKFHMLTETMYDETGKFGGRIYKIRHDENGNRITFMKILQGTLHVRDEVSYGERTEKITQIRMYNGNKFTTAEKAAAGEIVAVTGLSEAAAGDGLGTCEDKAVFGLIPTLTSTVIFDPSIHVKEMLTCFKLLDAEDPSLHVTWEKQTEEIQVHVMGLMQLEVLQQIVLDRFGYHVTFGDPKIIYKETIRSSVNGYGHFEPLRHYAEVHLKLEPADRGSGISFTTICHPNDLSIGHQNLIRHHLFERDHHGLLTGSALTDVKVTLLNGRGHNEHTAGGDFREATYRALRQGLEQADNVLLEPYYDFTIKVSIDHIGRVLSDIQQASGSFDAPVTVGEKMIVKGRVPVATFMHYSTAFTSYTNGRGALSLQFGGYDECHNTYEIIEQIGYNKDADPEYTSASIFCAKGKGYTVPWQEAEAAMHLLK